MKSIVYFVFILLLSVCAAACGNNSKLSSSTPSTYKDIKELDEAIQSNPPKIAEPYLIRAKFRMENKDFNGALSDAEAALKIDPKNNLALKIKRQAELQISQKSKISENLNKT